MSYNIEVHKFPDPVVVIRNWYTEEELEKVWRELDVLCSPYILKDETYTKSATKDGVFLKKAVGVFLDSFYNADREVSDILKIGRKLYQQDLVDQLVDIDHSFKHYLNCNVDYTLLNYYENKSEYKLHKDLSCFTANVVLWREPKKFDGGRFVVTEDQVDLNLNSNDMVIFPGYLQHSATQIQMHDDFTPWKSGRHTIVNFLKYRNKDS